MSADDTQIRQILHFFGDGVNGVRPGGFNQKLMELASLADPENKFILMSTFPWLVEFFIAKDTPDGLQNLRNKIVEVSHG